MFERLESMDKRTLVRLGVAAVIGILLFSAMASGIHQAGWNQGFTAGLLASGGDNAKAVAPYLAYQNGYGPHGGGGHGIGLIGGIFRFLFFGFLIMVVVKFFAFRRWRMHNGWHNGPQGPWQGGPWQHGPWQHGPWGQQQGQQPGQAQPQEGGGNPASSAPQPEEHKPQNTSWTNV